MDGEEVEESQAIAPKNLDYNPELVSIRKKLVAPNNILPGAMIRSQLPVHLLPVQYDFQSESGHKMLLDEVVEDVRSESLGNIRIHRSKNVKSRMDRGKAKSYFGESKGRDPFEQLQMSQLRAQKCEQKDLLQFLGGSLRGLFRFSDKIMFVSKTALLSNLKSDLTKLKLIGGSDSSQTNRLYLRFLQGSQHLGATPYAYDQFKSQSKESVPCFRGDDANLEFDDDFQSSNIFLGMRCEDEIMNKYRLQGEKHSRLYLSMVRLDYNTRSYGQWFYFKVRRKELPYSFNRSGNNFFKFAIINMTKSSSMFGHGLKVSVCRKGVWRKEGMHIRYYRNSVRREGGEINSESTLLTNAGQQVRYYYTLQFTLELFEGEQIYCSYNQPYTYTRMGRLLDSISHRYQSNRYNIVEMKRHVICQTYLNNNIEVVNFSAKTGTEESQQQKKVIFLMGRCHPVQTAGSHVVEGVLSTLSSLFIESPIEEERSHIIYRLLQRYVIKIIPMVNPDGVILGNSRCNIAGYDLNRSWRAPRADRCREILQLKRYILQYNDRIAMFIDLHAHSKKKNVFAYGCHDMADPFSTRQFPFLLSKLSENDFVFSECRFTRLNLKERNQKGTKDGTARVFLYDALRIPNIFTIENSYCSAKGSLFHYDKAAYSLIGGDILKAISLYFSPSFRTSEKWRRDKQLLMQENTLLGFDVNSMQSIESQERSLPVVNISLNGSRANEYYLNVRVNSRSNEGANVRMGNVMNLRQKYLNELRSNEKNITVGFMKDDVSDSEEEERIYEVKVKKEKPESLSPKKNKRHSKTTDKLSSYFRRSRMLEEEKKEKQKTGFGSKLISVGSNAQSEVNLAKIDHTSKHDRFYTLGKAQESPLLCEQESPSAIFYKKRMKQMEEATMRSTKKDRVLSIVDIGLIGEANTTHNYRFNLAQKIESKYPRTVACETETAQVERRQLFLTKKREEQIKDYLRKIIRPKQMLQRRQRFACVQQQEKKELRLKHSNIEFFPSTLGGGVSATVRGDKS